MSSPLRHPRPSQYLLLAVAPLCWAGNAVLGRGVVDVVHPISLAFWRWTVAFLLLLPFAHRQARSDWSTVVRHWKMMLFLSIFGISSFNALLYTAVHTTTAINCSLIQTAMPAVIILLSLVIFKEKVSAPQLFGVGVCIVGAGLVVLRGRLASFVDLAFVRGDLLMSVAVVAYALYSVFLRKRPEIHPLSFLVYTFGLGALCLVPVYAWELLRKGGDTVGPALVASVLYVAVFPSIVAYFCWNRGVEAVGANRAGLFINLVPAFASLMAIFWLDEALRRYHVVGMALILGGMVLFNRAAPAPPVRKR